MSFTGVNELRDRLKRSDWIVCAEALRYLDAAPTICGVISMSGPHGEPLACGYFPHGSTPHSWATLPTFEAAHSSEGQP